MHQRKKLTSRQGITGTAIASAMANMTAIMTAVMANAPAITTAMMADAAVITTAMIPHPGESCTTARLGMGKTDYINSIGTMDASQGLWPLQTLTTR